MDKIIEWIKDIVSFFENDGIASSLSFVMESAYKELLRGPANSIMESSLVSELYSAMIPIGLILLMIAFFMKLTEMALDDNLNPDKIIKEIILLVIVLMVMDNAVATGSYAIDGDAGWIQKVYHFVCDVTDDIISTTATAGVAGDSQAFGMLTDAFDSVNPGFDWKDVLSNIKEAFKDLLVSIVSMLILAASSAVISIVVFGVGVYRAVKIGIYVILSPIGMALAYDKGSVGLKHFKKLAVLFLQETVIILSLHILFLATSQNSGVGNAILLIIILISSVVSSESKARELIS